MVDGPRSNIPLVIITLLQPDDSEPVESLKTQNHKRSQLQDRKQGIQPGHFTDCPRVNEEADGAGEFEVAEYWREESWADPRTRERVLVERDHVDAHGVCAIYSEDNSSSEVRCQEYETVDGSRVGLFPTGRVQPALDVEEEIRQFPDQEEACVEQ